ncbi:MAG: hypothetical protein RR326_10380, partial [Stenotrophomonas sp.]
SARCIAAYLYTSAGGGESTTDMAWDGQGVIFENGELLAESKRFTDEPVLTFADIDLERLSRERMRMNTFLGKWLAYLAERGHSVATLRRVDDTVVPMRRMDVLPG